MAMKSLYIFAPDHMCATLLLLEINGYNMAFNGIPLLEGMMIMSVSAAGSILQW